MPGDVETSQPPGTGADDHGGGKRKRRWLEDGRADAPQQMEPEPSYYDVPMLKPPVWKWEVSTYFFLGGLSAGAYIISRLAERLGGETYRDLTRTGTYLSAITALPCAPLLIIDLGDRTRFHHMLRVFKPNSPMNLGSWTLTGYSGVLALAALREWARRNDGQPAGLMKRADGTIALIADVAGIPLALLLAGYTGVLLSATATPIWAKNLYLGALFSASAITTGASAVTLGLEAQGKNSEETSTALSYIATSAHGAEAATLTGFLGAAGDRARPLTKGALAPYLWGGVIGAGIVLPEILEHIPAPPRARRWLKVAASVLSLAGGWALRHAMLKAGHVSANDPQEARDASRAKPVKGAVVE